MNPSIKFFLCALSSAILIACNNSSSNSELSDLPEDSNFNFTYDFSEEGELWSAGFSDYPVGEEAFYELESLPLTEYTLLDGTRRTGFKLSGNNHSDDLFMYIKAPIANLSTNQLYSVGISAELAVNYGPGCFGIGGSPGESVYIKAGASLLEPQSVAENDYYQLNIDTGNQSQDGDDAVVLGNFVSPDLGCEATDYALITINNDDKPLEITTDNEGKVWLILGLDSGFEGITTTYIQSFTIDLQMN